MAQGKRNIKLWTLIIICFIIANHVICFFLRFDENKKYRISPDLYIEKKPLTFSDDNVSVVFACMHIVLYKKSASLYRVVADEQCCLRYVLVWENMEVGNTTPVVSTSHFVAARLHHLGGNTKHMLMLSSEWCRHKPVLTITTVFKSELCHDI